MYITVETIKGVDGAADTHQAEVVNYNGSANEVTIPQTVNVNEVEYTVVSIASNAFVNATTVTKINMPNTITTINLNAFNGCTNLVDIVIPSSVTTIARAIFVGCTELKTIKCAAASKPDGWVDGWNSTDITVVWGYQE